MKVDRIFNMDCIAGMQSLTDGCIQTCITSPPYFGLRDYGVDGQIGLEQTPEEYVERLVDVFREVRRVLRDDGTLWLNLGDTYAANRTYQVPDSSVNGNRSAEISSKIPYALKPKDLIGIPWRVAFALQADGWYLRQDIIWAKSNPMPESVRDRCTKSHEYIFLLSKSKKYYYDHEAIKEPLAKSSHARLAQDIANQKDSTRVPGKTNGPMKAVASGLTFGGRKGREYTPDENDPNFRNGSEQWGREYIPTPDGKANKKSVWRVSTKPFKGAHFAVFPTDLIMPCVLAGSSSKVCPNCGMPWKRVTEKGEPIQQHWAPGTQDKIDKAQGKHGATSIMNTGFTHSIVTTGWIANCACQNNNGTGKSIILDPFMGAGTTALVAKQLGRNYIGYELNPDYVRLAEDRLA